MSEHRPNSTSGAGEKSHVSIALVGHCGPDAWMLKGVAERAVPGAAVEMVNDDAGLRRAAAAFDVLLVNRAMDGEFEDPSGISVIAALAREPSTRASLVLVSNYADAQQEAENAGALPGFGKATAGRPESAEKIRAAVARARSAGGPRQP